MTADLLAFLAAVHDADEQAARAATFGPWYVDAMSIRAAADRAWGTEGRFVERRADTMVVKHTWPQEADHIARHDPQSVLARVEAERALAAMHPPMYAPRGYAECEGCSPEHGAFGMADSVEWPCPTLRALAWGYRHREGWRAEWAPDGVEVGA